MIFNQVGNFVFFSRNRQVREVERWNAGEPLVSRHHRAFNSFRQCGKLVG
jgi:hypothetical protein